MKETAFDANAFVGSAKATRKYQRKYVRYFQPIQRVLDIGCASGIFLEILRDSGVSGVGIDTSAQKVAECRDKLLDVYRADAFQFLKRPSEKFYGIFCSHFVEHFSPPRVLDFLELAHQALESDGLLIIITPNFKNIDVISERFWLDITHVRPYPLPLLEKMLESSNFTIISSGTDSDTDQKFPRRKPWLGFKYIMTKIRFGEYFGKGDSFVVARKS